MDPSQLLNAHSSRSGEDLLFDLDEERYGHSQHGALPAEPTTPSGPVSATEILLATMRTFSSHHCLALARRALQNMCPLL